MKSINSYFKKQVKEYSESFRKKKAKFINNNVIQCITMEIIAVRFKENILSKIDKSIGKHNFNSRTEFIREAVRDKLENLNRNELIKEFMKYRGKAKKKTTYEQNRKTREEVFKEIAKEKGWKI